MKSWLNKNMTIRFVTLDVFRGMTVFLMIVVNTQGSGAMPYGPLMHAQWDGCTLTDLVFPSFLFAMGNAMAFALKRQGSASAAPMNPAPATSINAMVGDKAFLLRIARRAILLFTIGFLLAWYPFTHPFSETRILSVLQRIALAYFLAALATRYLSERAVVWLAVILLLGYWVLLFFFGDPGAQYAVEGNAVRKLDLLILGSSHMYREGSAAFDPEGILSTIPAIVNVLAGWLAGRLIFRKGKSFAAVSELFLAGTILLVAALLWNCTLPFNKKLWTSSYALYSIGIDLIAMGSLFYLIEMRSWKRGVSFFSVFGRNPLFIYIFSNIIGIFLVMRVVGNSIFIDWINAVFFQRIAPGAMGCLLFSACFTLLCWSVGWILDRKKIYIRL